MNALGITRVRRSSGTSPEMGLTDMAFKGRISNISVGRRLTRGRHVNGGEGIGSMADMITIHIRKTVVIIERDGQS